MEKLKDKFVEAILRLDFTGFSISELSEAAKIIKTVSDVPETSQPKPNPTVKEIRKNV